MLFKTSNYALFWALIAGITTQAHAATTLPEDTKKAVILAYMRIGDDNQPDSNLTLEQFQTHLQLIKNGGYTVLPLPEILRALKNNETLNPKTIALTFDGAYKSAYINAFPLLEEADLPYSVFYSSEAADRKYPEYIGWDELKKLAQNPNVSLGVLPLAYDHIAHKNPTDYTADLNIARQKHRQNLGQKAIWLAYPYGEYSTDLKKAVASRGFQAAFGLHAGATYPSSDPFSIPRYIMTERYGNEERFTLVANALPFPVTDITPEDPYIRDQNFQSGFTIPQALSDDIKALSCHLSGLPKPEMEILGNRIEIRSTASTLNIRRFRLNCTLPGPNSSTDELQWRWFSRLYHRDDPENNNSTNANNPEQDELLAPQE